MTNRSIVKRVLVSYSKPHFDPDKEILQTSSAGVIAAGIYNSLISSGYQVDYIGPNEKEKISPPYDLFIGQPTDWNEIAGISKAKKKILFMPTSHPFRRNSLLRKEAAKRNMIIEDDLAEGPQVWRAFNDADLIMQIGNQAACEILIRTGVNPRKIIQIHYGIGHIPIFKGKRIVNSHTYLHLVTNLGLRKGFLSVIELFSDIPDIRLALMGRVDSDYWQDKLYTVLKENKQWEYFPWIDSSSREYIKIINSFAWMVFPTIEDVEPGVLQEAMRLGLVPLIDSNSCGVDFSIDGNFSMSIKQQIEKSINIEDEEYQNLSLKARRYMHIFHDSLDFNLRLKYIWQRLETGRIIPESTIIPAGGLRKELINHDTDYIVFMDKNLRRKNKLFITKIISWMEQNPKIGLVGCNSMIRSTIGNINHIRNKEKFIWEADAVSGFPLVIRRQVIMSMKNETHDTDKDPGKLYSSLCKQQGLCVFYYPKNRFRLKTTKNNKSIESLSLLHLPKPEWGAFWDPRSSLNKLSDTIGYSLYKLFCILRLFRPVFKQ